MELFKNIILIIFPIVMYLVFGCINTGIDNKKMKNVFIISIVASSYMCYLSGEYYYIFSNIPIMVCYCKRNYLMALVVSLLMLLYGVIQDSNWIYLIIKYGLYFGVYMVINKKDRIIWYGLIIQGILLPFLISDGDMLLGIILLLFICVLIFFCLYLFKIVDRISELYRSEREMIELNKIKDALFKLTHEIKNPLAVCKGYLEMIDYNDREKYIRYTSIIRSEIDRSLNVISDFMDYSKIKINCEEMDIVMLLEDIYEAFKMLILNKHIKLNFDSNYEEIYIQGDYERLKQVFITIIKNSIESIDNDGIIDLAIVKDHEWVSVIVLDNGIGMTQDEIKNIKEMFYTTKKNGTGLGVALSNEIVLLHHGEINYESSKNVGTRCVVKLPLRGED